MRSQNLLDPAKFSAIFVGANQTVSTLINYEWLERGCRMTLIKEVSIGNTSL